MTVIAAFREYADTEKGLREPVEKKLGLASIVLLAQNHNPSILAPEFLESKKILEGKVSKFAHTPVVSVVEYTDKNLTLNVTPDLFSLNFGGQITDDSLKEMVRIVISYFSYLPETPITAVGINFHGELSFRSEEEVMGLQEKWFKPHLLAKYLGEHKVLWGTTARFKLPNTGAVVTLKVEPNPNPLSMSLFVNGHYDVKGTAAGIEVLQNGPIEVLDFTSRMMSAL